MAAVILKMSQSYPWGGGSDGINTCTYTVYSSPSNRFAYTYIDIISV